MSTRPVKGMRKEWRRLTSNMGVEAELQEERRFVLAYKNRKEGSHVRTRLTFSNALDKSSNLAQIEKDAKRDTHRSILVFLLKTKKTAAAMEVVKNKLGSFDGLFVDCRGCSGLALLWDKSIEVTLLARSSHHMDVTVTGLGVRIHGDSRVFMGGPETTQKLKKWDMIRDTQSDSDLPWLLGGDLNEVLFNFETKVGFHEEPAGIIRFLWDFRGVWIAHYCSHYIYNIPCMLKLFKTRRFPEVICIVLILVINFDFQETWVDLIKDERRETEDYNPQACEIWPVRTWYPVSQIQDKRKESEDQSSEACDMRQRFSFRTTMLITTC
ncbi:hypothetical protein Cgig2_024179 [Carnegiea gigantea]|uniref:Endonuclease/exonuclease/phosphatase domain-containing protein n=1 Tax=Carnegiea gigantea TaxID=171969 RepID=A0A9Q1KB24_9CARY|nr:hypothetical protein Cgig2_024179 [Carnegiea gigantea]